MKFLVIKITERVIFYAYENLPVAIDAISVNL